MVLLGPQNVGKTTLFNQLTHSQNKVVNYPGSTVDFAKGTLKGYPMITLIDTPGLVSLLPTSEDERIALGILYNPQNIFPDFPPVPDLVIVPVEATQLGRHLVLVRHLQRIGARVMVVVTMLDRLAKRGQHLDLTTLALHLECPVISAQDDGTLVLQLAEALPDRQPLAPFTATEKDFFEDFNWANAIQNVVIRSVGPVPSAAGMDPDRLLLHPVWGGLLFTGLMALFFWSIFVWASPLMDGIDLLFSRLAQWVMLWGPSAWPVKILAEGLLPAVAGVLVFVPQIAILFFLLGILEGTGYLARGAVLIDHPLSKLGLNGRSFVPLLSGCACAIPAILSARSIPGRKERLTTMFVIPLMSCSARLPVYGLLIALLVGRRHPFIGGLIMTGIYFASIGITAIVAKGISRWVIGAEENAGFQIELPSWRWPHWSLITRHSLHQTKSFVIKAGPTIVTIGIVLFLLTQVPTPQSSLALRFGPYLDVFFRPMGVDWRVGIALLIAFSAREVFVSALAVVFAASVAGSSLLDSLRLATFTGTQQLIFTPASIAALIVFFMISMQCMSTLAVAKQEMGGWRLPMLMTALYVGAAYGLAILTYQLLHLAGL
jgi:ferrous iron transport protein B